MDGMPNKYVIAQTSIAGGRVRFDKPNGPESVETVHHPSSKPTGEYCFPSGVDEGVSIRYMRAL